MSPLLYQAQSHKGNATAAALEFGEENGPGVASPACTEVKRPALLLSQHARLPWLPLVPHCQPASGTLEKPAGAMGRHA